MRIVVIGAGGVGGYFGGVLSRAGNDVVFVARGEQYKALKDRGLIVKSIKGDFELKKISVVDDISKTGKADIVILALKAWQIKPLIPAINSILNPEAIVIPLQNGISTASELLEQIPPRHIVGGMCRIISMIESPGVILHSGVDPVIIFGELSGGDSPRLQKLKDLFVKSGIDARVSDYIEGELWKKFISICVSGLLAVTGKTYGALREDPQSRKMMIDLLTEVYTLSQAAGIKIPGDYVEKAVAFIDTYDYNATSSLTRDIWDGKPSEIEYQNGAVVRLAAELGVPVPVNKFVYDKIH